MPADKDAKFMKIPTTTHDADEFYPEDEDGEVVVEGIKDVLTDELLKEYENSIEKNSIKNDDLFTDDEINSASNTKNEIKELEENIKSDVDEVPNEDVVNNKKPDTITRRSANYHPPK